MTARVRQRRRRSLGRRRPRAPRPAVAVAGAVAAIGAGIWWTRTHPSPLPYGQRFVVQIPHPLLTRRRLLALLDPRPGEALLEVGPGTGLYTCALAGAVGPAGSVAILDIQREMLDHTVNAAARHGLTNVEPAEADARGLPYADERFDAAVIVRTLGEVPDQEPALAELGRVVRAGGRIVVGEAADDPHFVTPRALRRTARAAGLAVQRRSGPPVAYFALLRPPAQRA